MFTVELRAIILTVLHYVWVYLMAVLRGGENSCPTELARQHGEMIRELPAMQCACSPARSGFLSSLSLSLSVFFTKLDHVACLSQIRKDSLSFLYCPRYPRHATSMACKTIHCLHTCANTGNLPKPTAGQKRP